MDNEEMLEILLAEIKKLSTKMDNVEHTATSNLNQLQSRMKNEFDNLTKELSLLKS